MNGLMKQFEQNLYDLINNSQLQIGEAYYILKCALLDLEKLYNQSVEDDLSKTNENTRQETIQVSNTEDQYLDLVGEEVREHIKGEKGEFYE